MGDMRPTAVYRAVSHGPLHQFLGAPRHAMTPEPAGIPESLA